MQDHAGIELLTSEEIDAVEGGLFWLVLGGVVALAGLGWTAYSNGFQSGKDMAERDNAGH